MTIRTARPDDIEGVLELWESDRAAVASLPDTREVVERLMAAAEDALLVAERDGRVVGAIIAGWDGFRGNLYRLAVRADSRRQGIGRALVEAAHERLAAKGAARITALVAELEPGVAEFWQAVGYERDTNVARFVRGL
jgi:ribosomal protein S18 acetylase RimI-like enzyme